MGDECIAPSCNSNDLTKGVDMFYLPTHDKKAFVWLKVLQRMDLADDFQSQFYRVCSKHFSSAQFNHSAKFSRPRLAPHAVPDIVFPKKVSAGESGQEVFKSHGSSNSSETLLSSVPTKQIAIDTSNKKVVRLQLPPGVSAKDFTSSEALKKITCQLSGIIDSNAKRFTVKIPAQGISTSQVSNDLLPDVGPTDCEETKSFSIEKRSSLNDEIVADVKLQHFKKAKRDIAEAEDSNCPSTADSSPDEEQEASFCRKAPKSARPMPFSAKRSFKSPALRKPPEASVEVDQNIVQRQIFRNKMLSKIEKQKSILMRRGQELCKYRMVLNKLRQEKSQAPQMTLSECLKVLKGNMHDHALELLYTQLSCASPHLQQSHLKYTPKVLESALLFSVAGKKAYKALCQTIKLPPFSEIIKWKKIIRSNPQYYKKLFPNLRAKFFKRRTQEKGRGDKTAKSCESNEENKEESGSSSLSPEETQLLFSRLMEEQSKFNNILQEEGSSSNDTAALLKAQEAKLSQLLNDRSLSVDFELDAANFIEQIKKIERPEHLMGTEEDWEMLPADDGEESEEGSIVNASLANVIDNVVKSSLPQEQMSGLPQHNVVKSGLPQQQMENEKVLTVLAPAEDPCSSLETFAETSSSAIVDAAEHLFAAPDEAVSGDPPYLRPQSQETLSAPQPHMPQIF